MLKDVELIIKGIDILRNELGDVKAEKFVSLLKRGEEDFTQWRKKWVESLEKYSLEDINEKALKYSEKLG